MVRDEHTCTNTHNTNNKRTHGTEQQTVAIESKMRKMGRGGLRGEVGSTAGDLRWEKQISLKLVGEVDLSHSFSRSVLLPQLKLKIPPQPKPSCV